MAHIKAYIQLQLTNGVKVRYVRDVVSDSGVNEEYYSYGDTVGDTYLYQGDSGQIKDNFDSIIASVGDSVDFVNFPENGGDTFILVRKNYDQLVDSYDGDTIEPKIMYSVVRTQVQSVAVIEERMPASDITVP